MDPTYRPSHEKDFMDRPGLEGDRPWERTGALSRLLQKILEILWPQRGKNPPHSDEKIVAEVNESLWRQRDLDASRIIVNSQDGRVTLSGTVSSNFDLHLAEDCAYRVSGVVHVRNDLQAKRLAY